jgi:hypothetical protein
MNAEKLIAKAGGVEAVANELRITTQSVYAWQRQGYVPIQKLRAVAKMAGISLGKLEGVVP